MSEHDKRLTRSQAERGCGKVWRLATAGGDNLVMIWLVYPKPTISQVNQHREAYQSPHQPPPPTLDPKSLVDLKHTHPPIIEYLATLTKHQGVVNVVRFCPKGEMLASAGDDGNVLLWVLSTNTTSTSFGESAADKAYERESWRTRLMLRSEALVVPISFGAVISRNLSIDSSFIFPVDLLNAKFMTWPGHHVEILS